MSFELGLAYFPASIMHAPQGGTFSTTRGLRRPTEGFETSHMRCLSPSRRRLILDVASLSPISKPVNHGQANGRLSKGDSKLAFPADRRESRQSLAWLHERPLSSPAWPPWWAFQRAQTPYMAAFQLSGTVQKTSSRNPEVLRKGQAAKHPCCLAACRKPPAGSEHGRMGCGCGTRKD